MLRLVYVQLMLLFADILVIQCRVSYYEFVENCLIIFHTLEEVGYFKIQCGIFPHTARSCTQVNAHSGCRLYSISNFVKPANFILIKKTL